MKKTLSVLLAVLFVFSAVPATGVADLMKNADFTFLTVKSNAASTSDLSFELNNDGKSYYVSGCNTSATGALTIPSTYNGKPVTSIGYSAFEDCSSLTSVTIPDSVTSIGNYAFYECSSLTSVTIPDSVMSIGKGAFEDCSRLTSVTIPDSVTSIGYAAFYGCNRLTTINVSSDNKNYSSKDGVLFNKNKTELICCPEGKRGSYTIPDSVTSIGYGAFENCNSLTSVTIPDSVTNIGDFAFAYCSSLTSVTIPDSVTSIGYDAFSGCSSLTTVTIGNSVTSIGDYAFAYCDSLTSVTIPDSVTSIGYAAFYGCSRLTTINVSSDNKNYSSKDGVLFNKNKTELICCPEGKRGSYTIPDSVTSIGYRAFENCNSLTSVTIPDSVTSIGYEAFYGCSSLTTVTIGNSVTSIDSYAFYDTAYYNDSSNWENGVLYIGNHLIKAKTDINGSYTIKSGTKCIADYAFEGCSSLTTVTIGNSVTSIGSYAFWDCSSLTSVTIPDSVTSIDSYAFYDTAYYNDSSNWENGVLYIGNHLIEAKTDINGSYTIKSGTKCIADSAFYGCSSLTSVTIPDSVTSIGSCAFEDCSSLTSVTIPDSVTNIGDFAFAYCDSLTTVTIPDSVTSIGNYAFYVCSNLTTVTIPESVTSIGEDAFAYCSSLTTVTIPDSVTSIGKEAFYDTAYYNDSSNWKNGILYIGNHLIEAKTDINGSYTIKSGTKCIADSAFYGCSSLTSVTIPDSVTSIGSCAFAYCSNLTSVTIPDSVTSIGYGAFYGCYSLTTVTIPDSVTSIGYSAFYGCDKLTIYGKIGSKAQSYAKENGIPFKQILDSSVKVNLGKISNTTKGVKVTWKAVSGADEYVIYCKSGSSSYKAIKTVSGSTKSYTDTTAKSGMEYTYTVKASNTSGKSGYDKTGLSKLYLATPTVKTSNSSKGITVKWSKITGAKGYYVYRKAGSGKWTKVKEITSGSTFSFTDTNVKSGTKYSYYVKAYNGKTVSSYKASTTLMFLSAVKLSSASSGKTGITVKWGKVTSAKGYYVYRKTGSGSYKKIATVKSGSTVKYVDKSAKKGTTYTYYVKAYNGSYTGSYANALKCKDKY